MCPEILGNSREFSEILGKSREFSEILGNSRKSTEILETSVGDFGIEIDASLFLMGTSNIQPHLLYLNHELFLVDLLNSL